MEAGEWRGAPGGAGSACASWLRVSSTLQGTVRRDTAHPQTAVTDRCGKEGQDDEEHSEPDYRGTGGSGGAYRRYCGRERDMPLTAHTRRPRVARRRLGLIAGVLGAPAAGCGTRPARGGAGEAAAAAGG